MHPDQLAQLSGPRWAAHAWMLTGGDIAQHTHAKAVWLSSCYQQNFGEFSIRDAATSELVATRLGTRNLVIEFPQQIGPFGHPVSAIVVPGYWSQHLNSLPPEQLVPMVAQTQPGTLDIELPGLKMRYSRLGLEKLAAA